MLPVLVRGWGVLGGKKRFWLLFDAACLCVCVWGVGHAIGFTFNTCCVGVFVPRSVQSYLCVVGCCVGGLFVNCIVVVSIFLFCGFVV